LNWPNDKNKPLPAHPAHLVRAVGSRTSTMFHFSFANGVLGASLQTLSLYALLGIIAALLLGGMVKGVVSIGVPLVAMPILSQFMPIKEAVLLLSMPIILGNIPQALEGGDMLPTVRRIAAPLIGTVAGAPSRAGCRGRITDCGGAAPVAYAAAYAFTGMGEAGGLRAGIRRRSDGEHRFGAGAFAGDVSARHGRHRESLYEADRDYSGGVDYHAGRHL
jgi:hypothetical protein